MNNGRICILMMDSLGVGASADAKRYGDEGANTLGHIMQQFPQLAIPNLRRLGLLHALAASSGMKFYRDQEKVQGQWGYAKEQSFGKDTPSGHWEMMGLPVLFDWGMFPNTRPCFPQALIDDFLTVTKLKGVLGNCHASGTTIIDEFGAAHIDTGFPIVYTSADSVFQIAAHEQYFGLERLYQICEQARVLVDDYQVGRVIARPFVGEPGKFVRTANRKDYTTPPHADTLLDLALAAGHEVIAIGKIADIFAHRGIGQTILGENNQHLFDLTLTAMETAAPGSLVFTNFVDFDSKYGHRRDIAGYAKALEEFDQKIIELEQGLKPGDLVFIVADHGCDPSLPGSDHTREHIPVLMFGPGIATKELGCRQSFADIGQTIASYWGLKPLDYGQSFWTA